MFLMDVTCPVTAGGGDWKRERRKGRLRAKPR